MTLSALILAGSRGERDALCQAEAVAHKALIEVEGVPLLARVHAALSAAGIERIAVSCSDAEVAALARRLNCTVLEAAPGPSASVAQGFAALGAPLLVTTADHALLRPQWVRQFIADTPADADVSIMLAERHKVDIALPNSRRTWLKFADGEWSGCNLFYLAQARAKAALTVWSEVERNRKRPWKIAARLGVATLWLYLRGRLTLAEAVARLGRRIGIEARAVAAADGLAAVDVDKLADLADVRRIAAERRASGGLG